ncbi:hypothetical protein HUT17_00735 [Nocardiopsis flavescens]|nr:hypothetical protein HUT17_00735 [Nocardiopsis flavescens]
MSEDKSSQKYDIGDAVRVRWGAEDRSAEVVSVYMIGNKQRLLVRFKDSGIIAKEDAPTVEIPAGAVLGRESEYQPARAGDWLDPFRYEMEVARAVARAVEGREVIFEPRKKGLVADIYVPNSTGGLELAVDAFKASRFSLEPIKKHFARMASYMQKNPNFMYLLVTPWSPARIPFRKILFDFDIEGRAAVVQWRDRADDEYIARAIRNFGRE